MKLTLLKCRLWEEWLRSVDPELIWLRLATWSELVIRCQMDLESWVYHAVPKLCEQSDLSTVRFQPACHSRQSISQIKCRACVHSITSCFAGFAAIRENLLSGWTCTWCNIGPIRTSGQNWNCDDKIEGQILSWQILVLSAVSAFKFSKRANSHSTP